MNTHEFTVVCCKCNRIKMADGWRPVNGPEHSKGRQSHGYCPECFKEIMVELDSSPVELMAAS